MAAASSMDRITQWVSSQEVVPADLTVRIADSVFPLHKSVMAPKCGYIRRAVAAAAGPVSVAGAVELDLSALPGGADAFEKAARYCYGGSLDLTARDAAALRCAAAFLDFPDLSRRADDFLAQSALRSLPNAAAVLRSCESLLPAADELGVTRRAADAVALGICNETLFPTATAAGPGWWADELAAALSPASFRRVLTALRCRRAGPAVVAGAAVAYAERVLAGILPASSPGVGAVVVVRAGDATLVEAVVEHALPSPGDADAPLPAAFLCRLLRAAVTASASAKTCRDMELRVAAVLDQATADDLLAVALDGAGERLTNADTVRRVIAAFFERHQRQPQPQTTQDQTRRSSMAVAGDDGDRRRAAMEKVARTVDEVAAEMAAEPTLPISKFVGVAGAVPRDARPSHDCLYRAVDIYLKTHPELDEIEREKVCSAMDPLKLSYQARLHASQNKRLPLQAVLSALYYDQLKLRSADGGGGWETQSSAAGKVRAQARADAALARENEALRTELARMRAYVSGMQQQQNSKGSGSRSSAAMVVPAAAAMGKKASFLGSVSRTLSRLNPFKGGGGGWAKDTASIVDGGRDRSGAMHVVKPKRRRFSIG